jgi:LysM repeat protein
MRKIAMCFGATLLAFIVLIPLNRVVAETESLPHFQTNANVLIAEVNALRVANGLPAYTVNPILMQVAQDQANYMAATGQVSHRPGLTQRILDAGYPLAGDLSLGGFRAENITGGNKTAAQAVMEWTGDALHTNTMLSPNLTEIGAGVAKVGDRYYLVIDCALPTTGGQPQFYTPGPGDPVVGTSAPSDFIVPITTSTPDENGLVYHEVQYGQTLWSIAIEYGVKIDEIRALNSLGPETDIYQGDRLLVRKDAPPPATFTVEALMSPTNSVQLFTSTSYPAVTPGPTEALTGNSAISEEESGSTSVTGIAIGIILVAILLAGMMSWMSSRNST